ncbi:hypothetical protein PENTCL1PPCAC_8559, partial [Pristionchus entomophagus]
MCDKSPYRNLHKPIAKSAFENEKLFLKMISKGGYKRVFNPFKRRRTGKRNKVMTNSAVEDEVIGNEDHETATAPGALLTSESQLNMVSTICVSCLKIRFLDEFTVQKLRGEGGFGCV